MAEQCQSFSPLQQSCLERRPGTPPALHRRASRLHPSSAPFTAGLGGNGFFLFTRMPGRPIQYLSAAPPALWQTTYAPYLLISSLTGPLRLYPNQPGAVGSGYASCFDFGYSCHGRYMLYQNGVKILSGDAAAVGPGLPGVLLRAQISPHPSLIKFELTPSRATSRTSKPFCCRPPARTSGPGGHGPSPARPCQPPGNAPPPPPRDHQRTTAAARHKT